MTVPFEFLVTIRNKYNLWKNIFNHENTSDWPCKDANKSFTEGSLGSTPGSCRRHEKKDFFSPIVEASKSC